MAKRYIFFYVPNIIGYIRLILVAVSYYYISTNPKWFLMLYCASMILDGFDGFAARALDQVTTFGAWLDVVIDNLSRGMLWCFLFQLGWLISSMEWLVFVCTHTLGKQWKDMKYSSPPVWVQAIMAHGFKTPIGAFVIIGLDCLPIWLYLQKNGFLGYEVTPCAQMYFLVTLITGRLLCMTVEIWFIFNHIRAMAAWDRHEEALQDHDNDDGDGDDDHDEDNASGGSDDLYQEETSDDFSKETKPMPSSNVSKRTRRHTSPALNPTPGSTMTNMALASQHRRASASNSPRQLKKSVQQSKLSPQDKEQPQGSARGKESTDDMRQRRPPSGVNVDGRRPETDFGAQKSHYKGRRRSEEPSKQAVKVDTQRRWSANPDGKGIPQKLLDRADQLKQEKVPDTNTSPRRLLRGSVDMEIVHESQLLEKAKSQNADEPCHISQQSTDHSGKSKTSLSSKKSKSIYNQELEASSNQSLSEMTYNQIQKIKTLIPTFQDLELLQDTEEVNGIYQIDDWMSAEQESTGNQYKKRQSVFEWIGETRVATQLTSENTHEHGHSADTQEHGHSEDMQEDTQEHGHSADTQEHGHSKDMQEDIHEHGHSADTQEHEHSEDMQEDTQHQHSEDHTSSLMTQAETSGQNLTPQSSKDQEPAIPDQQGKRKSIIEWIGDLLKPKPDTDDEAYQQEQQWSPNTSQSKSSTYSQGGRTPSTKSFPQVTDNHRPRRATLIPTFQDLTAVDDDEKVDQDYPNEEERFSSQPKRKESIFEWIGETRVKPKHSKKEYSNASLHSTSTKLSHESTNSLHKRKTSLSSSEQKMSSILTPFTKQSSESTHHHQQISETNQLSDVEETLEEPTSEAEESPNNIEQVDETEEHATTKPAKKQSIFELFGFKLIRSEPDSEEELVDDLTSHEPPHNDADEPHTSRSSLSSSHETLLQQSKISQQLQQLEDANNTTGNKEDIFVDSFETLTHTNLDMNENLTNKLPFKYSGEKAIHMEGYVETMVNKIESGEKSTSNLDIQNDIKITKDAPEGDTSSTSDTSRRRKSKKNFFGKWRANRGKKRGSLSDRDSISEYSRDSSRNG